MREIYMDYNAGAPLRDDVLEVFWRAISEGQGNASSAHVPGRRAKAVLDRAREKLAAALGARPREIVFTAGGTESDNLALKGVALRRGAGHIVTTTVEHPAVLEACRFLERECFEVTYVDVDGQGRVSSEAVEEAIREDTILVSVMWANNETGVVMPIEEIARVTRERGIPLHTDAVQAFGRVGVDAAACGADLISISGHKFGAPKGVGALYVRSGLRLEALLHGGGQEGNVRSGTHDVAAAAALAEAARLTREEEAQEATRLAALRDGLEAGVVGAIPGASVNGGGARVANTCNVRFEGADGEAVLMALDAEGIAASSASACAAAHTEPSYVLVAMGLTRRQAQDSMRFSLGRQSTPEDVDRLLDVLPGIVEHIRSIRT